MHPVLLHVFSTPIHTFGVLVAVGFLAAMWWCRREAARLGFSVIKVVDLTFWLMIWGLLGARALFVAINWQAYAEAPITALYLWNGGLVWYGGFLTALFAGLVLMRRYGLPVLATCDLLAPAVMFGLAFGRLGCLAAGDDHGKLVTSALGPKAQALLRDGLLFTPDGRLTTQALDTIHLEGVTAPWWALTFDARSLVQADLIGLPLYPTQIIMSAYCLAIFVGLAIWRRYKSFDGQLLALLLIIYPICRYLLEFLRGDLGRGFWLPGVSTSQGISVLVATAGAILYLVLRRLGIRAPTPAQSHSAATARDS